MPIHLNDAGTWRRIRRVYVNDAGTWRTIKHIHVNDAGTWRRVFTFANAFEGTLMPGAFSGGRFGFAAGVAGTLSPSNVLADGKVINEIQLLGVSLTPYLRLSNLGGVNPGASYLDSITFNSITLLGSDASYTFDGIFALWQWPGEVLDNGSYPGALYIASN